MLSYHNDPALKLRAIEEMREHQRCDRLVKGTYGEGRDPKEPGFLGCMIGCLGGPTKHYGVAHRFGFPLTLCRLFDSTFEGLPDPDHIAFTTDVLEAIPVGATLEPVVDNLACWLLADEKHGVIGKSEDPAPIQGVITLFERRLKDEVVTPVAWHAAIAAVARFTAPACVETASYQAYYTAHYAANFGWDANPTWIAYAARRAARVAYLANKADSQGRSDWWQAFAAEMIRLLRDAKGATP